MGQDDDDTELCAELDGHFVLCAVLSGANEMRDLASQLPADLAAEREYTGVYRKRVGLWQLRCPMVIRSKSRVAGMHGMAHLGSADDGAGEVERSVGRVKARATKQQYTSVVKSPQNQA